MPHHQQQPGGIPSMMDVNGHAPRNSLPSIGDTHHHHGVGLVRRNSSLSTQSQQLSQQATPYSRTPELRVSHKLAERKRRKEMKDLFDELRDSLPAERGGKSSKWEVLTKAIEYVQQIKTQMSDKDARINSMEAELQHMKNENDALRNELFQYRGGQQQQQQQQNGHPPHPQHIQQQGGMTNGYGAPPQQQGRAMSPPPGHGRGGDERMVLG